MVKMVRYHLKIQKWRVPILFFEKNMELKMRKKKNSHAPSKLPYNVFSNIRLFRNSKKSLTLMYGWLGFVVPNCLAHRSSLRCS